MRGRLHEESDWARHLRAKPLSRQSQSARRRRTIRPKGYLSNKTALVMIFKLAQAVEKR
jgi:hypothetical protein